MAHVRLRCSLDGNLPREWEAKYVEDHRDAILGFRCDF